MQHQVVGGPAAGREHAHHAFERVRELVQQRHVGVAAGDDLGKLREAREVLVGTDVVRGARAMRELDRGDQRTLQQAFDARARGRARSLHASPVQHAAQPLRGPGRVAKALLLQVLDQRRIVAVARRVPRSRHRRLARGFGRLGEHGVEHAVDEVLHGPVLAEHRLDTRRAEQPRDARPRRTVGRQHVGLGIVDVLQGVLEVAQEHIGRREPVAGRGRQHVLAAERGQRLQRRARAQARIAPGADDLERLRDELDLAYPAAAELDVVGAFLAAGIAPRAFGADQSMQITQRVDRAEVEILAEHERPHDVEERPGLAIELPGRSRTPARTRPVPSARQSAPTRAPGPSGTPRASRSKPPAAPHRRWDAAACRRGTRSRRQ